MKSIVTINEEEMLWLQNHAYLLSLSGYSPDVLIGGRGAQEDLLRWQYAVNFAHSGLLSGALGLHDEGWLAAHGMNLADYVMGLSINNPFDAHFFDKGGAVYWLEPEMFGTEIMDEILLSNPIHSLSDDVNYGFSRRMLDFFEGAGFPWGCGPRISV